MNTDDLIKALAADAPSKAIPIGRAFMLALAAGLAISLAIFLYRFGVRHDIAEAIGNVRYPFKLLVMLALAVPAAVAAYRLARPEGRLGGWSLALLAAPVLLALGLASELLTVPLQDWQTRLIGHNSRVCLVAIPVLSLAPLIAMVMALRYGAVTQPRLAALVAGLAAAGAAAFLYGLHCPDDSPLFVATWYTMAVGVVAAVSMLVAPRLLRW